MAFFYTASASKDWRRIHSSLVPSLTKIIEGLAHQPRQMQSEKLTGSQNACRLRKGDYRILYTVDDSAKTVIIYKIAHRREAYR
ncbi:MAG: hypothetical protein A3G87_00995 [Omnitrophica bacterium RIFCSPLOWO2_12_FULL_50_11]|nr:MAG: hypothetical protein A3G87_00995 [Omnitrophica bacterium RIFCSPLOWO2_12_FULL_50_11]